jgi:hypothetical protein
VFKEWTVDASGTAKISDGITMSAAKTATASWTTQYYLTVTSTYSTPDGEGWYDSGVTAYASVVDSIVAGSTGTQYVFKQWTVDASGTYLTSEGITMDAAKAATASWTTQYYLTVTSAHSTLDGEGWYDDGATAYASVTDSIEGATGTRYVFKQWTLNATGTHILSEGITMTTAKTAVASWTTQYYLTVTSAHSTPYGEGWYDDGAITNASVDDSIIAGSTGTQYIFASWTVDASGTHLISDDITMDAPKTATVSWTTQYYLTVTDGGHSSVNGEGWYDSGVTAYASVDDSILGAKSGTRYVFKEWTIDATGTHLTSDGILMDAPKTATVSWTTQYYLTVTNGDHSNVHGEDWYDSGTTAYASVEDSIVGAKTSTQYVFKEWTIDATGTHLISDGITMDRAKTATADWTTQYELIVSAVGNGHVDKVPDQIFFDSGTMVHLTAVPDEGWSFVNWIGDLTSVHNPDSILMDGAKSVTANLGINMHTLTTHVTGSGSIEKNPDLGSYEYGTWVHLTANAVHGWHFVNWTDSLTGINNPDSICMTSDKEVTAHFALDTFLLTINTTGGNGSGTVERDPSNINFYYTYGTKVNLTANPDVGSHFISYTGDIIGSGTDTKDSVLIDADKNVTATFNQDSFTITASAGSGGSIDPTGSIIIPYRGDQPFEITADAHHHIVDVLVDGETQGAITHYDFTDVTTSHTIEASFQIDSVIIEASAGANGSIDPSGVVQVPYNGSQSFTIAPADHYHIVDVLVDGETQGAITHYDFTDVTTSHTIEASFQIDSVIIEASAGENGSIDPIGVLVLPYGGSQSYTITADVHYHVMDVLVDGGSVGAVTHYDFTDITTNHTIEASFQIDSVIIEASAGAHGSIDPVGVVQVPYSGSQSFTITADAHYHISDVLVDGETQGAITHYDFTGITTSHTIEASFVANTYTLSITCDPIAGGSVDMNPPGGIYDYSTDVTMTALPATGYHFVNWTDSVTGTDSIKHIIINSDKIVTAHFATNEIPGWYRKADILSPNADTLKAVGDGGALVAVEGTKSSSYIYAFHGNKSNRFYQYTPVLGAVGSWSEKDSLKFRNKKIPPLYQADKKFPAAGASLAYDEANGYIYAIKANSTRELWVFAGDTWHLLWGDTLPQVKGIKNGSSLVYNPADEKLYLLAGLANKKDTNTSFVRYTPSTHTWEVLPRLPLEAPVPPTDKRPLWADGACMVMLRDTFYALRTTSKQGLLYKYDGAWHYLDSVPYTDTLYRKTTGAWATKKINLPKAGTAMASNDDDNIIYMIKGNGSTALWKYTPHVGWSTRVKDTIPNWGRVKGVKNGAALTYLNGRLYLLKGNKTRQFWTYVPPTGGDEIAQVIPSTITSTATVTTTVTNKFSFEVSPNPFTRLTTIRYTVPISGKVSLKLYNATGQLINTIYHGQLEAGSYAMRLTSHSLAKGIYFLKFETKTDAKELKLIVE